MKKSRPVALLLIVLAVAGTAAAATAREMYAAALERERLLHAPSDKPPTLATYRAAVNAFESVVRRHPATGYADNALWEGAQLAVEAAQRFESGREKETAVRLLTLLINEYPSSSLRPRASDQLKDLASPPRERAVVPARGATPSKATPDAAPTRAAAAPPLRTGEPPASADAGTGAQPSTADPGKGQTAGVSVLRDVRRAVVNDVVRITIELSEEVNYKSERVENPPRVFFDLPGSRLGPAIAEGTLSYSGDLVRHIRIGRHPNRVTRVVIDLEGVKRYAVFTLYSPYRIIVDCEREAAAAVPLEREAVREEPVRLPPPPPPEPPAPVNARPLRGRLAAMNVSPAVGSTPAPFVAPPNVPPLRPTRDFAPHYRKLLALLPIVRMPVPLVPSPASPPRQAETAPPPPVAAPPATTAPAARATTAPAPPAASPAVTDISRTPAEAQPAAPAPAAPTSRGNFSLARQLGLGAARIVIDPGHGGHDPGAEGPGTFEANVVLDVALRLEKLLRASGSDVVLTRRSDEYIPLEERTAIANRAQGDLFLSIHANASRNRAARGVESYFLNFATTPDAEAVAARENASTGRTMSSLTDIVKAITLNNKLNESRSFAALVQQQMVEHLRGSNKGLRDHGVKQAPFVVLIGASMPSVLVEISFITNSQEGRLLKSTSYRQKVAEALADAIRGYQKSLKNTAVLTRQ